MASSPLTRRLLSSLPPSIRNMLALLSTIFSLRNVLLLFCLLNLKNLPLAWELRLLFRSWRAWISKGDVARMLETGAGSKSRPSPTAHPLFAPLTISSRTPLLEIDHNIHKSNSTYFSDLDESRTALIVRLLSPTKFSPAELESEGFKGPFAVILGSVHASFLKEIKAYERYWVRSRVLGWDEKWILIGSVFVRPENAKDRARAAKDRARKAQLLVKSEAELKEAEKSDKRSEVLLATCLSKYVIKKGRYTVPPERCWRSAGWLPHRPADRSPAPAATFDSSSVPTPDPEPVNGQIKLTENDLKRKAQEAAAQTVEKLQQAKRSQVQESIRQANETCWKQASKWSWDDIEEERCRGLKLAESWLALDRGLKDLWNDDFERGIVA